MTTERAELPEQVRIGAQVTLELVNEHGDGEPLTVTIVREQFADLDNGLLDAQTPLAKAMLGKRAGLTIPYRMGDIRQIRILDVRPAQTDALADTEARRQAALQAAVTAAERTTAEMFAASYSGKWGDYALGDDKA